MRLNCLKSHSLLAMMISLSLGLSSCGGRSSGGGGSSDGGGASVENPPKNPPLVVVGTTVEVPTLSYVEATGTSGTFGLMMSVSPTTLNNNGAGIEACGVKSGTTPLPSWASVDSMTCVISGTPNDVLASTVFTIVATNSAGQSADATVILSVGPAVPSLSYSGASGTTGTFGVAMSVIPTTRLDNGAAITSCGVRVPTTALPSWANVNPNTCVISGTPNAVLANTTYTLVATNSSGTSSDAVVSLSVAPGVPTLSYAGASGTSGTVGVAMTVTPATRLDNGASITACGVKLGTTALPSWASVDSTTCVISGTPTGVLSLTSYTIVATNSVGDSSDAVVNLYVGAALPTLSYAGATGTNGTFGSVMSVSPTVLNNNGAAITSCGIKVPNTALPSWASVNPFNCVISGTPNAVLASTVYTLVATNSAGQSADATVALSVAAAVPTLSYSGATGTGGAVGSMMSVSPTSLINNGAAITACGVKSGTTALPSWASVDSTTCVISGTPTGVLSATSYTLVATNAAGNSSDAVVTLSAIAIASVPTLSYSGATGTGGVVGSMMSVSPTVLNNNGAAITACGRKTGTTALPSWASVNPTTCVIFGTPDAALSATTYTIVATNSAGNSSDALVTLSATLPVPTLSYAGATGTYGAVGSPMSITPTTFSDNGYPINSCGIKIPTTPLPSWASVNPTTCVISGTPNAALPSTNYTLVATNDNGTSSDAVVSLSVVAAAPTLSYVGASGGVGSVGTMMSVSPTVLNNNGAAITTCGAKSGTTPLPSWVSVDPTTCVISGTPSAVLSETTYTIVATNSVGNSSDAAVTLSVIVVATAPTLSYAGATTTNGVVGFAMAVLPTNLSNNGAPITACGIKSGTTPLPSWASVNPTTCVIFGTPNAALSSATYTLVATNSLGQSPDAAVSLSVSLPLDITPAVSVIHPSLVSSVSYGSSGGSGGVAYNITSGSGSINSSTGVYSVDTSIKNGTTSIRATDAGGQTSDATLIQIASRFNSSVSAIVVDNGFGYFGGAFDAYNPHLLRGLGRLNLVTGNLEAGCNLAGLLSPGATVMVIVETSTDIFAGGTFTSYAGTSIQNLIKVNKTTCRLDQTFTQTTAFNGTINALAVSGSSLYVGGSFTTYRGSTAAERLAKLDLASGNLDTTFTQTTGANGTVSALVVSGSSLYVGGSFTTYRGSTAAERLAKLDLTSGNLDTTFTQTTAFNGTINALAVSGSSLYVGGSFTTYRGSTAAQRLAKVDLTTGDLDTTFTQSTGASSTVNALAVSGSSLYVGGSFTTYRGTTNIAQRLAKVDLATGDLDTTFTQSTGFSTTVNALVVSGSSLYVGGQFTSYRGTTNIAQRLAKVDLATGDLDTTFTRTEGLSGTVRSLVVSGSSLYVGGAFATYRGTPTQRLAKVDLATGNIDTTFTQTTGANGTVSALVVSGSSLYVGGSFTTYRGTAANYLAKLDLTSGALDTTFTQTTGFNSTVIALAVSGSSLYVGGGFTTYRGTAAERLAKLDLSSGNLDTAFTKTTGASSTVNALVVSGSSLYVGGSFTTYRGTAAERLAKLDLASGNLDTTFTQTTGFNSTVSALVVLGSSLYGGGSFTTYRGTAVQRLAKVDLASGNLDTTFTQSTGASSSVSALVVSGSSLYVGGSFTTYRGTAAERLAKLDLASGNLDTTFTQTTGANGTVSALVVSGSSLYVGGAFNSYRGVQPQNAAVSLIVLDLDTGSPSGL